MKAASLLIVFLLVSSMAAAKQRAPFNVMLAPYKIPQSAVKAAIPASAKALSQKEQILKGSWYNPSTSGQGFLGDVIESPNGNTLFMSWYTYSHDGSQKLWFVLQAAATADTTRQDLVIYETPSEEAGAVFNQPPIVQARAVGNATITIVDQTNIRLDFTFNEANMAKWGPRQGTAHLSKILIPTGVYTPIEESLRGSWYNPATSGQGFQLDLIGGTTNTIFMSWYTYTNSHKKLWFVLQGQSKPHSLIQDIDIYMTPNGRFNQGPTVQAVKVGRAMLTVRSSSEIEFSYSFTLDPGVALPPASIINELGNIWGASGSSIIYKIAPARAIDPRSKSSVTDAYRNRYKAAQPAMNWTGNIDTCNAGTISLEYQQRSIDQVNFYRDYAGLQRVTLLPNERNVQEASLMATANTALSHNPPTTWRCYTQLGASASGVSNLSLGGHGVNSINAFISSVSHRRWVLSTRERAMSVGAITDSLLPTYFPSTSLGVVVDLYASEIPALDGFVAWPTAGFTPYNLLPKNTKKWSFSVPRADFAQAQVTVTNLSSNTSYAVTIDPVTVGMGDNTIVFNPEGFDYNTRPTSDQYIAVSVKNVRINGVPKDYSYTVIVYNAD
jgi:hypothetical protein